MLATFLRIAFFIWQIGGKVDRTVVNNLQFDVVFGQYIVTLKDLRHGDWFGLCIWIFLIVLHNALGLLNGERRSHGKALVASFADDQDSRLADVDVVEILQVVVQALGEVLRLSIPDEGFRLDGVRGIDIAFLHIHFFLAADSFPLDDAQTGRSLGGYRDHASILVPLAQVVGGIHVVVADAQVDGIDLAPFQHFWG